MGTVIFTVLLVLIALAMFVVGGRKFGPDNDQIQVPRSLKMWALVPVALAALLFLFSTINVISPGNEAVPVTFGTVGTPVGPGIHIVAPWTKLHSVSIRTQQYTMVHDQAEGAKSGDDSIGVLGSDAGTANVDATLLYHIEGSQADDIYRKLGGDYVDKIVRPTARTCIRDQFASVAIIDAATGEREAVAANIKKCISDQFQARGLVLEEFQLRNISLNEQLQQSVTDKVSAQQQSQQKVFELQKAEADARITTVNAKATADSQQILACGGQKSEAKDSLGKTVDVVIPNDKDHCNQSQLTPEFLQYSYIQSLKSLVDSPNNSTVILPFDQKLTPLLNLGK